MAYKSMENRSEHYSQETSPEPELVGGRPAETQESGFVKFLVDVLETLVLSVLLFLAINAISARIRVDGSSMEPSLKSGEFVIVNRLAYRFGDPQYGDVVVFHFPGDPGQEYIKRIIGLPGDTIQVSDGIVYVNDHPLNEPYIAAKPRYQGNWIVPQDHLFVLGDNRNNSSDSHNWGAVPMENVIGKAFFVYWPPMDWGVITATVSVNAASLP
jgi:signal peptidase I